MHVLYASHPWFLEFWLRMVAPIHPSFGYHRRETYPVYMNLPYIYHTHKLTKLCIHVGYDPVDTDIHSNHNNRHESLVHITSLISGILVNRTRMVAPIHHSFGYCRRGKLLCQIHLFANKKSSGLGFLEPRYKHRYSYTYEYLFL
jgi:hypothetical protein